MFIGPRRYIFVCYADYHDVSDKNILRTMRKLHLDEFLEDRWTVYKA
jgi:adenine-specific DNA methylase